MAVFNNEYFLIPCVISPQFFSQHTMAATATQTIPSKFRLYHLTFYKAGSQWIRDVLSDPRLVEHSGHSLAASGIDLQSSHWPELSPGQLASPLYSTGTGEWQLVARPEDRAFVVIRDPRDIVVSLVYSVSLSHAPTPITLLLRDPISSAKECNKLRIGMFLLAQWAEYLRSWKRAGEFANVHLARYETLIADLPGELARLCAFLQWRVPQPVLDAIAESHSFASRAGREPNDENPFSHRRKGIAGDWRNHFNRATAQLFETVFPGLLTDLGYETANDWWESVAEFVPDTPMDPEEQRRKLLSVLSEYEAELAVTRVAAEERLRDVHLLHEALAERNRAIEALQARLAATRELTPTH